VPADPHRFDRCLLRAPPDEEEIVSEGQRLAATPGGAPRPIEQAGKDRVWRLATLPARVVARLRPDLGVWIAEDAARFSGAASSIFKVLVVVAVAYPIAASLVHALGDPTQSGDSLLNALRPGFDAVYAESIPFMLAAVGLGLLSPALGVLFLAVFVPADLLAANGTPELTNMSWQVPGSAILARIGSYGLLWILAVEIPLRSRALALAWTRRSNASSSAVRTAVAFVAFVAIFVYLWASTMSLLITPVFAWTVIQVPSRLASDPVWYYWPIIVAGAAVFAVVAAVWPRPLASTVADGAVAAIPTRRAPRSRLATLARESAIALLLALLLGGLMTTTAETIVIVLGLLVAGPGLTLVLPRLPAPVFITRMATTTRFAASMAVVFVADLVFELIVGKDMFATDYLPLTVLVVGSLIAFRVLVGAGRQPAAPGVGTASPVAVVGGAS
jgi:hypothetical protein